MGTAGATAGRAGEVGAIRSFNRYWTRAIGALDAHLLDSPYSLTEVRVVFELAQRDGASPSEISDALGIDPGYLSRILRRLKDDGLVASTTPDDDGRRRVVRLTGAGGDLFAELDRRATTEIERLLEPLSLGDRDALVRAMDTIREVVERPAPRDDIVLRSLAVGDLGWVLERHGALYSREHGFDAEFEALVARVLADYAERRDAERERGWIAAAAGRRAGSIFCMRKSDRVAQLRLLLVEPWARRMGIGGRLVDECLRFARDAGYEEMMLWTKDVLHDARRIYERAGFVLVEQDDEPDTSTRARGQFWRLAL